MNGLEQVKQYATLAGDEYRAGDLVDIRQLGRAEVMEVLPGGMLRIRTADRCPVLIRAAVCRRVQR